MKFRKLIALMLSVFVMAAMAVVPSFAATTDSITYGIADPASLNDTKLATGTRTVKKVYQTFQYTQEAHPIAGQGCYSITKGVLKENGKNTNIYLIAVHGTETAIGQNCDVTSDLYAGFDQSNDYLKGLMKVIKKNVPKNANIIIAGHSLGGMVAQQAAANSSMQKRYNIMHVITWGSPLLSQGKIEGELHRMASAGDVVPYLSYYTLTDFEAQRNDRNYEEADVIPVIQSHVQGYHDKNAWKDYDALGVKGGKAVLKMNDDSTVRFYGVTDDSDLKVSAWVGFDSDGNWMGISILL